MDTSDPARSCTRFHTKRMGLMTRSSLGSGLSGAEMRVVLEVAGVADAARLLAMSEGHACRLFEKRWITQARGRSDGRVWCLGSSSDGQDGLGGFVPAARDDVPG